MSSRASSPAPRACACVRDSRVIYEGKIGSLRRFKDDASEVRSGFECGIGIERLPGRQAGRHHRGLRDRGGRRRCEPLLRTPRGGGVGTTRGASHAIQGHRRNRHARAPPAPRVRGPQEQAPGGPRPDRRLHDRHPRVGRASRSSTKTCTSAPSASPWSSSESGARRWSRRSADRRRGGEAWCPTGTTRSWRSHESPHRASRPVCAPSSRASAAARCATRGCGSPPCPSHVRPATCATPGAVSVLGDEAQARSQVIETLARRRRFLRRELAARVELRTTPELRFRARPRRRAQRPYQRDPGDDHARRRRTTLT
jgi:hypothetical protein